MEGSGRYILYGFLIFLFVIAVAIFVVWLNHRHDFDRDENRLNEYHTSAWEIPSLAPVVINADHPLGLRNKSLI